MDVIAGNPDLDTCPMHFRVVAYIADAMRINVNLAKLAGSPFGNSERIISVPTPRHRREEISRYM